MAQEVKEAATQLPGQEATPAAGVEEEAPEVKEEEAEAEAGLSQPSAPNTQGDALLAQQLAQELEKGSYAQVCCPLSGFAPTFQK